MKRTLAGIVLALAALMGFGDVRAQAAELSVEGFFGYYDPDSVDEDGEIYGGRFGYKPNDNFGLLLSAGVIDLEDDFLDTEISNFRADLFLIDLSLQWFPTGGNFYAFAGPGWATIDIKVDFSGPSNNVKFSDDVFTLNAGLGYMWTIGDSFFIRPEAKVRYFDGDDFNVGTFDSYEGLDREFSVGLGWRFGG